MNKQKIQFVLILGLILTGLSVASAQDIFNDDFSYDNAGGEDLYDEMIVNNWTIYDNNSDEDSFDDIFIQDIDPIDDEYVVVRDHSSIIFSADTTGLENIVLSYYRRINLDGFQGLNEEEDTFEIWVKIGGNPWTLLESTQDTQWTLVSWDLVGADDQEEIRVEFRLLGDAEGHVDSILMTGIEIDEDGPEISNVQHEPEFPTCSNDVTICADVTDASKINLVKLIWEFGENAGEWKMVKNGDTYCRTLSASTYKPKDAQVMYFSIGAEDEHGNQAGTDEFLYTYDCSAPTVDFECSPLSGPEDHEISCEADTSDTVDEDLDYVWSFIGGSPDSSMDENPEEITYFNDGFYTVSLTATDDAGHSTTETKVDYIDVLDVGPEASFNESAHEFGESEEVFFTDTSTSHDQIVSWSWDFGDEETSEELNPSHTYADNGEYLVTLTVCDIDEDCDTASDTKYVYNEDPEVNAGEYECDEGETILLTAEATDVEADMPLTYEWDFNGDEVYDDATGDSVEYTCGNGDDFLDGTVSVRVMDKDEGAGYDNAEITVYNVAPTADADGPYQTAVFQLVCFDGSATDAFDTEFSFMWDFDYDGEEFDINSVSEDPCTVYLANGEYTIALKVNDGDVDSEIDTSTVTVFDYGIELDTGWNLVSIPLVPEDDNTSINFVFDEDVSSRAEKIWSYTYDEDKGKNVWKFNEPIADGSRWTAYSSRVQEIIPGYGYYIFMDDEVAIYQNGEKFYGMNDDSEDGAPIPPEVKLTTGLNLIGHYGLNDVDKEDEVQDLSGGILTDLADVTLFNEDALPADELEPTEGYWAFITGQDTLLYAPSAADYEEDFD